jgi:hypothetical protein
MLLEVVQNGRMSSKADRDSFSDAVVLAAFANLRDEEVENFRRNYPDFVPDALWDYTSDAAPPEPQWKLSQGWVRAAWERWSTGTGLELFRLVAMFTSVSDVSKSFATEFGTGEKPAYADIVDLAAMNEKEYPFHRAVAYLNQQPWRAKKCAECGRYIVVRMGKTKYCDRNDCGNNIREQRHRAAKLRYWHKNKGRLRKQPSQKSHKTRGR